MSKKESSERDEDPPPYSELAETVNSVTIESSQPMRHNQPSLQTQPVAPAWQPPPGPPNRYDSVEYSGNRPNASGFVQGGGGAAGSFHHQSYRPSLVPPNSGSNDHGHGYYQGHSDGINSGTYVPPPSKQYPAAGQPYSPNPHLRYPSGYWCPKCHNTGIKIRKGTTCQDCYERFGVRNNVQTLPYGVQPVFSSVPRVVAPGDPALGGRLCGRCRGAGMISEMLIFESTCPVCQGVGRVF